MSAPPELASPTASSSPDRHPSALVQAHTPYYSTALGATYLEDALAILSAMPAGSVNAVVTSPPYALHFKKAYGNADKADYVAWFLPFAREMHRILRDDGSFILNIGGSYNAGTPTRSLYHFKLLIALVEEVGFHVAQECFWYNPAKMPVPAEWVNVRRIRIRDSVEYVFWLGKTAWPKANNRSVLRPYSPDMERLIKRGLRTTVRPSGHAIKASFSNGDAGGAIPSNVVEEAASIAPDVPSDLLKFGNNAANDQYTMKCKAAGIPIHPARFPAALPDFFIRLVTEPGDLVVDPFTGSNTTGAVSESLGRRWIGVDQVEEYLKASVFRFEENPQISLNL